MNRSELHADAAASVPVGPDTAAPDLVLANLEWVRSLSRRLVQDAASADDLVQQAWLVAHGKRPVEGGSAGARAWLRGVLKNLARDEGRRVARRRLREVEAVRGSGEGTEPPDQLIARSEQMTEVARLVLELEEPFRRTMLLRWFDGLTPAEIAERDGVPAGTVRTRLHRGLKDLRAKLDAQNGGETSTWALALLPMAGFAAPSKAAGASGAPVAAKFGGVVAAALVIGGMVWVVLPHSSPGRASGADDTSLAAAAVEPASTDAFSGQGERRENEDLLVEPSDSPIMNDLDPGIRVMVAGPVTSGEAVPVEVTSPRLLTTSLQGQVVLPDGSPVPQVYVNVRLEGDSDGPGQTKSSVLVDSEGYFELEGLQPGVYRASVVMSGDFPIIGSPLFATGKEAHVIRISARVFDVRAISRHGEPVAMNWVKWADVLEGDNLEAGPQSTRWPFSPAREQYVVTVPTDPRYFITAGGVDGVEYVGLVDAGMTPGRRALQLKESPPALGSLVLKLESHALPSGIQLLSDVDPVDVAYIVDGHAERVSTDRLEVRYAALLPGPYRVSVGLQDGGPLGLLQDAFEVDIVAGVESSVSVLTFQGGLVEVSVTTSLPFAERTLADLQFRRVGAIEWEDSSFKTFEQREGGMGHMINSRTLVNGPSALSFPWKPGAYELRATLDGHGPAHASFRILEGQRERIELTLLPN